MSTDERASEISTNIRKANQGIGQALGAVLAAPVAAVEYGVRRLNGESNESGPLRRRAARWKRP